MNPAATPGVAPTTPNGSALSGSGLTGTTACQQANRRPVPTLRLGHSVFMQLTGPMTYSLARPRGHGAAGGTVAARALRAYLLVPEGVARLQLPGRVVTLPPFSIAVAKDGSVEVPAGASALVIWTSPQYLPESLDDADGVSVHQTDPQLASSAGAFLAGLLEAPTQTSPGAAFHTERLAREMLAALLLDMQERGQRERAHDDLRDRALGLVWQRYADPQLSPAVVAAALNISQRQLSRVFRERHSTVVGTIRAVRVAAASNLIASDTSRSLDEVSVACGFITVSGMRQAFRSQGLVSPGRMRRGQRQR